MTAANTLQRRARSAALNAPCAVKLSRIGTPLGFLDIDSLPVQLGMLMETAERDFRRGLAQELVTSEKATDDDIAAEIDKFKP
jgi:hypothetical protein